MRDLSSAARPMIDIREVASLSQGSIFNYAYNERYNDIEILGLIITARCDISNDKTKTYSYLPVVPFDVWKENALIEILIKNRKKSLDKEIQNMLADAGFSKNTLAIYGPTRVLEVASDKITKKKTMDALRKKLEAYILLNSIPSYDEAYKLFGKEIKSIVKNIIENKNSECFFIDNIPGYGACVVNLREISHLDSVVAEQIAEGIDFDFLSESQIREFRSVNTALANGLALIIGLMKSPYIELLMQRFADLYTRIGVDDPACNLFEKVCDKENKS